MKTKQWLSKAETWVAALPVEMVLAWEKRNPGRKVVRTLDQLERGSRLGNYLIAGIVALCLLAVLMFSFDLNMGEGVLLRFLIAGAVLWASLGLLDISMVVPSTCIEQFMRSLNAMRECGLVPASVDGSQKIDMKAVLEFARARLTQNARFVLNAQTSLQNLNGSGLDAEIAIAAESVLTSHRQLSHALKVAVEVGLSTGEKTPYFLEAEKRK